MDDPWDSPWATDVQSQTTTPAILAPSKHDSDAEQDQDQGFSNAKQNGWASDEWSSEPWTRNADSAISLGENTAKLDGDQGIWTKHGSPEFKKQDGGTWKPEPQITVGLSQPIEVDIWDRKDEAAAGKDTKVADGWTTNDDEPDIADESVMSRSDSLYVKRASQKRLSKVQELVTMYDDMAAIRSSSDLGKESDDVEESPEGAVTDDGTRPSSSDCEEEQIVISEPEAVNQEAVEAKQADQQEAIEEPEETPEPQLQSETEPEVIEAKHDGPSYPIHLSKLDELLPSTRPIPRPDIAITDAVPVDSFTNISQRKTWYRTSRYGSSRKHDSGEGYTRVTWANSQVRIKTIQIVRRWMEQDSIAGRVVLGGKAAGAIGASLFNWDSNEPAVEIDELLKKRRDLDAVHTRVHSAPAREPAEKDTEWTASAPTTPAAGTFDRATIPKSPWEEDTPHPPTLLSSPYETGAVKSKRPSPILPPTPFASAKPPPGTNEDEEEEADHDDDDDEDEDWGEMVTSPAVNESGTFSSLVSPEPPQESRDSKETSSIQVLQPPEADNWDIGGWASVPAIDEPKVVSSPAAQAPSPTVASPFAEDGGWGFGDMRSFDTGSKTVLSSAPVPKEESTQSSTPLGNQTFKKEETLQDGEVDGDAVASALHTLPNLTYMLN